jgi:hypothetical protein
VKLVVHDYANLVETGGLLAASGLLVEAQRAYRRENIVAGQLRARAVGVRFGRPPVRPNRLEKVRVALREGLGVRETARSCASAQARCQNITISMPRRVCPPDEAIDKPACALT